MMPSKGSLINNCRVLAAILALAGFVAAQEAQQTATSFYDVQLSKDEIYKYADLKFKGDYTSIESTEGLLALGTTEAGVTVIILLGKGRLSVEAPEALHEKFKTVFNGHPLNVPFTSVYMRLNPKEYAETIGKLQLTRSPDDSSLAKVKEIYDQKFLGSYHAGPRAILPPYKTRVFEFDTPEIGQISNEEGYWITLRRLSPYGSVYPARFVNPKQK